MCHFPVFCYCFNNHQPGSREVLAQNNPKSYSISSLPPKWQNRRTHPTSPVPEQSLARGRLIHHQASGLPPYRTDWQPVRREVMAHNQHNYGITIVARALNQRGEHFVGNSPPRGTRQWWWDFESEPASSSALSLWLMYYFMACRFLSSSSVQTLDSAWVLHVYPWYWYDDMVSIYDEVGEYLEILIV